MMQKEQVWLEFNALPPEAQYLVSEFMAFLRVRSQQGRAIKKSQATSLLEEPFIGMWKEREEMHDSTAYVRNLRQREWARGMGHG